MTKLPKVLLFLERKKRQERFLVGIGQFCHGAMRETLVHRILKTFSSKSEDSEKTFAATSL